MRAEHRSADPAAADWAGFAASETQAQLLAGWLAILCGQVGAVRAALVLLRAPGQGLPGGPATFTPAAVWPDERGDFSALGSMAQRALAERRGMVMAHEARPTPDAGSSSSAGPTAAGAYLAYPVEVGGELEGAIVLDAAARPDAHLQQALRLIHWGSAWLVDLIRQRQLDEREQALDRLALVNAVIATALQQGTLRAAALAVVNDLATRLACQRVSLGLDDGEQVRVEAVSNTAHIDARTQSMRLLAEAMAETLDDGEPQCVPPPDDIDTGAGADGPRLVSATSGTRPVPAAAHAALAADSKAGALWSVPLVHDGAPFGVLCFERETGPAPDARTRHTTQVLGLMLGPVLALQRDSSRGVPRRVWDAARNGVQALFGPRHGGVKLLASLALLLVLFLALASGEYRVSATTVVEGAALRATAAPFDGFIAETAVRAGDVVKAGQLLARLDDRDLRVELARWNAEREQHERKLRQALAQHERGAVAVLAAQVEQAAAQEALVAQRLERAVLRAPFDGVVVSGDLRQLVGTPVEQGKVLFEVAPAEQYRIVLKVDERDIGAVQPGQRGELVLSGLPGERLAFVVKQITPVAVAEEGRNVFRVEAAVEAGAEGGAVAAVVQRLRPGMEGVGKISAGERRLWWIWTHGLTDWLRVALWSWLP